MSYKIFNIICLSELLLCHKFQNLQGIKPGNRLRGQKDWKRPDRAGMGPSEGAGVGGGEGGVGRGRVVCQWDGVDGGGREGGTGEPGEAREGNGGEGVGAWHYVSIFHSWP